MLTPYQFASNTPIIGVDLDGLELSVSVAPDATVYMNAHFTVVNASSLSDQTIDYVVNNSVKPAYLNLMQRRFQDRQFQGWFTHLMAPSREEGSNKYFIIFVDEGDPRLEGGKGVVDEIEESSIFFSTNDIVDLDTNDNLDRINFELQGQAESYGNSVMHEFGHLLKLMHIWDTRARTSSGNVFTNPADVYNLYRSASSALDRGEMLSHPVEIAMSNLMSSGVTPSLFMQPLTGQGGNVTDGQYARMYHTYIQESNQNGSTDNTGNGSGTP